MWLTQNEFEKNNIAFVNMIIWCEIGPSWAVCENCKHDCGLAHWDLVESVLKSSALNTVHFCTFCPITDCTYRYRPPVRWPSDTSLWYFNSY